jgi:hypothetical protein
MLCESESTALAPASVQSEQPCKFGTIVQALWPIKPALNLSQRIGCTERAARLYIDGERKPSARCIAAIVNEALE